MARLHLWKAQVCDVEGETSTQWSGLEEKLQEDGDPGWRMRSRWVVLVTV